MTRYGVLYISYTGMLEPLGQSQVLAYLEGLAQERRIHVVSFERARDVTDGANVAAVRERMRRAGIAWHLRRYHKQPSLLATLWDIAVGAITGLQLVRRHELRIVHARSYVPASMALLIKWLTGVKFLFDMRGFWVDERVDGGLWPKGGWLYRAGKRLERRLLLGADHVVSLTHAGVRAMHDFDYLQRRMPSMTVIPTCADLDRFRPRPKPDTRAPFTLGYVGSVGTWYLFDMAVSAFMALRKLRANAHFLVVNKGDHTFIRERLAVQGVPADSVELLEASHAEIPGLMARMDAGVFFIKPVFSKQASAPTKLAEFLGCGIPCLANAGVGDLAELLEGDRVGIALRSFDPASLEDGLQRLLLLLKEPGIRERCTTSAQDYFSLSSGVDLYRSVYLAIDGAGRKK